MTKNDFLLKLKEKLEILDDEEIKDILSEYSTCIDEKMIEGLSEEDSVSDFGDIDKFANEILSAYKLKSNYVNKSKQTKNYTDDILDKTKKFVCDGKNTLTSKCTSITHKLNVKNKMQLFLILISAVILSIILFPVLFSIASITGNTFFHDFHIFGFSFLHIGALLFIPVYIIVTIYIIYSINNHINIDNQNHLHDRQPISFGNIKEKLTPNLNYQQGSFNCKINSFNSKLLSLLKTLVKFGFKLILILASIPFLIILIVVATSFMISIYLLTSGSNIVGISLMQLSFIIALISFFTVIYKLIVRKNIRLFIPLSIICTSAVIFGFGLFYAFNEFTTYQIVTLEDYNEKTYRFEYDLGNIDMIDFDYYPYQLVFDNSVPYGTLVVEATCSDDYEYVDYIDETESNQKIVYFNERRITDPLLQVQQHMRTLLEGIKQNKLISIHSYNYVNIKVSVNEAQLDELDITYEHIAVKEN